MARLPAATGAASAAPWQRRPCPLRSPRRPWRAIWRARCMRWPSDPKDGLAAALARLGRAFMARRVPREFPKHTCNSRLDRSIEGRKTLINKMRLGEAVLRGGFASAEAAVRAVNAEPWEPLPGMVKRECPECRYVFAAPASSQELRCQDFLDKLPRGRQR